MKTAVNFSDFCDRFAAMDRNEQFSYDGKRALFDYLEEYEESTGQEIELDVIALCCEYTEYESAFEAVEQYDEDAAQSIALRVFNAEIENEIIGYWDGFVKGMADSGDPNWRTSDDLTEACIIWLNDRTQVIEFDGGVIIQGF